MPDQRVQKPKRDPKAPAVAVPPRIASTPLSQSAVLVFAVALVLRLVYLLSIHRALFFQKLQTEPLHYHAWASLILSGTGAPRAPFEQSPGYAYFVAAIYALFGHRVTTVACVQALLDASTCALLVVVGRRWFGARAGLIAGWLAAFYGPFLYFAAQLLPSTLFVFLSVAALAAGALAAPAAAGGLWATALLVRSEAVFGLPFVWADAWMRGGRGALWRIVAPVAVCIATLVAFNVAGSGRFVLFTTSGGVNLWLGNNPHADGVNPFISGPLQPVVDDVSAHSASSVAADRLFRDRALEFMRQEPGRALRLLGKKLLWTLTDRELPNTDDVEWVTGHSWLFRRPVLPLSFGMVLPFALAGAWLLGRQWRHCLPLAAPLATGLMTCVVFFTNARFRLIMVPPMLLLAAVSLDRLPSLLAAGRSARRAWVGAGLMFGVGLLLAWGDWGGVRAYRIPQISVNTGVLEREAGEFGAAVRHLREGLAADPRDGVAWIHLALALEQQGDVAAARQAYRDAQVRLPDDPEVRRMAAQFLARHPETP